MKLDEDDVNYENASVVVGGKDGKFLKKADLIDKFCRREIKDDDPALGKPSPLE